MVGHAFNPGQRQVDFCEFQATQDYIDFVSKDKK